MAICGSLSIGVHSWLLKGVDSSLATRRSAYCSQYALDGFTHSTMMHGKMSAEDPLKVEEAHEILLFLPRQRGKSEDATTCRALFYHQLKVQ